MSDFITGLLSSNGNMAVVIGRDGVPSTGANYITPDTYRHFISCLD